MAVNHIVAIALWVFPWSQRGIEMKESGSDCLTEDAIWLAQGTVTLRGDKAEKEPHLGHWTLELAFVLTLRSLTP